MNSNEKSYYIFTGIFLIVIPALIAILLPAKSRATFGALEAGIYIFISFSIGIVFLALAITQTIRRKRGIQRSQQVSKATLSPSIVTLLGAAILLSSYLNSKYEYMNEIFSLSGYLAGAIILSLGLFGPEGLIKKVFNKNKKE